MIFRSNQRAPIFYRLPATKGNGGNRHPTAAKTAHVWPTMLTNKTPGL
jgi:hypothetical protein